MLSRVPYIGCLSEPDLFCADGSSLCSARWTDHEPGGIEPDNPAARPVEPRKRARTTASRRTAIGYVLIGTAALAAPPAAAALSPPQAPLVLFVCQAGTVKSAIARELFLRRARERSITVAAFSRGISPADHVSPQLAQRLAAKDIDSARQPPLQLAQADLDKADVIVVFDPIPASMKTRSVRDWTAQPAFNDQFDQAWPWLEVRIGQLLDELSHRATGNAHE